MEELKPITRREVFLAKASGQEVETPTPVTREEVFLDAIAKGGGSSLPAVTPSDNGKVLGVVDGAWATDSSLFVVTMPTYNTADKTYAETVAAVEAGKNVVVMWGSNVYTLLAKTSSELTFVGNIAASYRSVFGSAGLVRFKSTGISVTDAFCFMNNPNNTDNGSELIVKDGAWAMQKKKYVVTMTPTALDYSGTMDKTVAEINAAYEAGMEIWANVSAQGKNLYVPLKMASTNETFQYPSFDFCVYDITSDVMILVYTAYTDDGTKQTYSTKLYSLTPAS